jgi:type VI secretion system (T6SS) effector TldE1-like protein
MWTYEQSTGRLYQENGEHVVTGYSGAPGASKNNPDAEALHNIGPIPDGSYTITPPIDTRTHGPYVLWLTPDPTNIMHGRSAFGIHGDSVIDPGSASEGCIVLPRFARETIWLSGDHRLKVVRTV